MSSTKDKKYRFSAEIWLYSAAKASWHFVNVPADISGEIRYNWKAKKAAWGSVRVTAEIGDSSWQTSIFYQKNSGCYLLPLKVEIRKKEALAEGDKVSVALVL